MALTKFTTSMDIISALADEPNDVGGLTAAQLKAKFDEGCKAIQSFVNNTLTTEIDANFATKTEVQGVVLGQIPDGTITAPKLSSSFTLPIEKGGTGATTPEAARSNLGIVQTITGATAPTTATVGVVGQFYFDTVAKKLYQCVQNVGNAAFTWKLIPADKIGDIKLTACTDLGSNWALCNGAVLSLTDYPTLASVISRRAPISFANTESLTSGFPPCPVIYGGGYYVGVAANTLYYSVNKNGPFSTKTFTGTADSTSLAFGVNYFAFFAASGSTNYVHTFKPSTLTIAEYVINSDSGLIGGVLVAHMGDDNFVFSGRKSGYYSYTYGVICAVSGIKNLMEFQYIYAKIEITSPTSFTMIGTPYDSNVNAYGFSHTLSGSSLGRGSIQYLNFSAYNMSNEGGQRWAIGDGKYIGVYASGALKVTESSTTATTYNIPTEAGYIQRDGWLSADLKYYYIFCYNSTTAKYTLYAFDTARRIFLLVNTFPFTSSSWLMRNQNDIQFYNSGGLFTYTRNASEGILLETITTDGYYAYTKIKEE